VGVILKFSSLFIDNSFMFLKYISREQSIGILGCMYSAVWSKELFISFFVSFEGILLEVVSNYLFKAMFYHSCTVGCGLNMTPLLLYEVDSHLSGYEFLHERDKD